MKSDHPVPIVKQETDGKYDTLSTLYRQDLTLTNLFREQKSRDIQVEYQKMKNVERERYHSHNISCQMDVGVIEYADDEVEICTNPCLLCLLRFFY